jgi:hypothetical protein
MTNREMFEKSFQRPKNFFKLEPELQWGIDKSLGILDWDHGDMTEADWDRFRNHYED